MVRKYNSVSPEEIIASGGTTAFAIKSGKTNESLKQALRNAPLPEPFTDEEWEELMKQMKNDR